MALFMDFLKDWGSKQWEGGTGGWSVTGLSQSCPGEDEAMAARGRARLALL